jgi:hypothetical protein
MFLWVMVTISNLIILILNETDLFQLGYSPCVKVICAVLKMIFTDYYICLNKNNLSYLNIMYKLNMREKC